MNGGIKYKKDFIPFDDLTSFIADLNGKTLSEWEKDLFTFIGEFLGNKTQFEVRTSGSTGRPKKIMVERDDLLISARITNEYLGLSSATVALHCLPSKYIAGKMMFLRAWIGDYMLVIVEPRANPLLSVSDDIDFIAITPYQTQHIILQKETEAKLKRIQHVIIGGSAPSASIKERVKKWPNNIYSTYGMTESLSHVAMAKINSDNPDDFYPVSDVLKLSQDIRNCLTIETPYKHAAMLESNDFVSFNKDGSFKWIGRSDNVINSGGIKHSPEVIENKLSPIIPDPFIISSKEDEILGDQLILVIESEDREYLKESFKTKLMELLDKYELPKEIVCISSFNRLGNDKIDRSSISF